MRPLPPDFYARPVVEVARELLGCTVWHGRAAGVIVETEAYHESEPACHAFVGLTPRTRPLFGEPGRAYVYRSYGVHALLNAVCEPEGVGAAVLIRALAPLAGIEHMRALRAHARRARAPAANGFAAASRGAATARPSIHISDRELCSGPGKLTQALGVTLQENDTSLASGPVRIGPPAPGWERPRVLEGTRIGISRAVELRWRFCVAGCAHVSRPYPQGHALRARSAARGDAAGR